MTEQATMLGDLTTASKCFTIDDIKREKYWISRVKEILKQQTRLSLRHRRSESKEVQQLLRQEAKLFESDDDALYLKNKERHQIVLPHTLKKTAYRELHTNMVHLGVDRTLQLIGERFYQPKMGKEIGHFINHQCQCVR